MSIRVRITPAVKPRTECFICRRVRVEEGLHDINGHSSRGYHESSRPAGKRNRLDCNTTKGLSAKQPTGNLAGGLTAVGSGLHRDSSNSEESCCLELHRRRRGIETQRGKEIGEEGVVLMGESVISLDLPSLLCDIQGMPALLHCDSGSNSFLLVGSERPGRFAHADRRQLSCTADFPIRCARQDKAVHERCDLYNGSARTRLGQARISYWWYLEHT